MNRLELEGVTRRFGGLNAVQDVSLHVGDREIVGLIGPNGAGKTTVVNMITGLLALSAGKVRCMATDITVSPPDVIGRSGVARTFQNIRLAPTGSVIENIMVGFHRHETAGVLACLFGLPSARREVAQLRDRAMALLERFNMTELADLPAGALPYGHQRRVEIMRALALEPKLLLLDEPVAGMNDVEAEDIAALIRDLRDDGVSVLLVEHNMRFVTGLCDRLYVLDGGRLIAQGLPAMVIREDVVLEAYLGR